MTEIALFHSVLGLREGVFEAAERLRAAGHVVHVPDLYHGAARFDDYAPAMAYVREMGYPELIARTWAAVEDLPSDLFYAGFSNGGVSAQLLAGARAGARGLVLLHAAMPLAELGLPAWPAEVPIQMHCMDRDPFRQQEAMDSLAADVRHSGAGFFNYDYPGAGHLFTDPSLPQEYDHGAAELLWRRVITFLDSDQVLI